VARLGEAEAALVGEPVWLRGAVRKGTRCANETRERGWAPLKTVQISSFSGIVFWVGYLQIILLFGSYYLGYAVTTHPGKVPHDSRT